MTITIDKNAPLTKKWIAHIFQTIETSKMPSPTFHDFILFQQSGDRQQFEKKYFARRKRLAAYGLLHALYPKEGYYLQQLEEEIWQILQEFTWCLPAHIDESREYKTDNLPERKYTIDLFAAETAFTLAEMIALFDNLNPFLIDQMKHEINKRVIRNFIENGPYHWETANHNWASVCAGSIGSAALYIMEDSKERDQLFARIFAAMDSYLSGIGEDGACTEGYNYWKYGFGYFVYFLELYERVLGTKTSYWSKDKVKMLASFQQKVFLAENNTVNFSDAQAKAYPLLGFTHFLSTKIPNIHVPSRRLAEEEIIDHCGRWAPAFRELLWYESDKKGSVWSGGSWLLQDSQLFISRHKTDGNTFAFAAKGGHNDEPHNHLDIGHFILFANGETYCKDLGAGVYSKDYFNEHRYSFLSNAARGHSIPQINSVEQGVGQAYKAEIVKHELTNSVDKWKLDMTSVYPSSGLKRMTRTFRWEKYKFPSLLVEDEFYFQQSSNKLTERFVLADLPYERTENGLKMDGLEIRFLPMAGEMKVNREVYNNHFGENQSVLILEIEMKEVPKQFLFQAQFQLGRR